MIKQAATIVGAVMAATVAFAPAPSQADATLQFHFGVNPGFGHGNSGGHYRDRLSCREVRSILRHDYGFRRIRVIDCLGDSYKFYARRSGARYKVKVNAWTGEVTRVRRVS